MKIFYLMAMALAAGSVVHAAAAGSPKPETLKAWDDYILASGEKSVNRAPGGPFLQIHEAAQVGEKIRRGQIVVLPAAGHIPKKVPSGLIHDWMGATFIPGTTIKDVLGVLRDYPKYKETFAPRILDSKTVSATEMEDRFSVLLMNKSVISKTALDCEYETRFFRVDEQRMYSITEAKQIKEIADYGTPKQRVLAPAEVTGLIWKLYTVSRFEERNGGLYMETEAMALSRDIPSGLHFIVEPIVRRVSRDAMEAALKQTTTAVVARRTLMSKSQ